ncbi:MAG: MmcQ/YjbR family DNA-binding protein [Acidimicrobiales bacterium]|nr:MmcQ/YjbR family DNA-binding protein [Acidimicrobiales bacterium]
MASTHANKALSEVRSICLELPEVSEKLSHGAPSFFIRDKKMFVMFHDNHHGDEILGIWCAAPPGVQQDLVESEPDRFYRPAYVGHRGWLGVRLDVTPDWDELRAILIDAYLQVAPATLAKKFLDSVNPNGKD